MKTYLAYKWTSLFFSDDGGFYDVAYAGESAEMAQAAIKDEWDAKIQTWQGGELIEETHRRFTGGQWHETIEKYKSA
jgi:hypothetical protein